MRVLICFAMLSLLPSFFGHAAAASLSGTIFANGGALPDVQITLSDPQSGTESLTSVSNASGVYGFDVDPGTYRLQVQPPPNSGFGDLTINDVQVETAGTLRDIFLISQSNTLSGTVTMSDGRAVAGANITIYVQGERYYPGLVTLTTDAQGFYSTELVPGSYALKVYIHTSYYSGFDTPVGSYENRRQVENIDLSTDAVQNVVLPYVSFAGRTLDSNGVPVPGVEVQLGIGEAGENYGQLGGFTVRSDDQGEFSALTPPATYDIQLKPPVGDSGYGITQYTVVDISADTNSDFVIESANTLSGTVTMSDGRAVAGANITIYVQGERYYPGLVTLTTDAQGFYSTELVPGSYALKVYIHTSYYSGFDTPVGSYENRRQVENIDLSTDAVQNVVLPYVSFAGRTLDSNGVPVPGVEVQLGIGEAGENYGQLGGFTVRSDDQGEFSALTPPAIYDVTVLPPTESGFGRTDISAVNYEQPVTQDVVLVHGDESPPVLLSESVVSVLGAHSATVQWLTDEPSTSDVYINGELVVSEGLHTQHSVALTGLLPATSYTLTVGSTDSSGNTSQFDVGLEFTTTNVVDTRSPEFAEQPRVSTLSHNAATLEWISSEPSTTDLVYGVDFLDQIVTRSGLHDRHKVELSDLEPATDYRFRVSLTDESGNGPTNSAVIEFRTDVAPDVTEPLFVSPPVISGLSDATVSISWQTNEPTISALTLNDGSRFTVYKDLELKTVHEVSISELTASTDHEYTVSLVDAAGNGPVLSETSKFRTRALPDIRAPSLVSPLKIVGITHKSALIHWRTDEPASAVLEYGRDAQNLTLRALTLRLSENGKVQLTGLDESAHYFYRLRTRDAAGNEWLSAIDSFHTRKRSDQARPRYTKLPEIEGLADNNITLSWETDEPAQGVLQYREKGSPRVIRQTVETKAQYKSVTLVGLLPGASYSYSITSTDSSGNVAVFDGGATETPVDDALPAPRQPLNDAALTLTAEFTTDVTSDDTGPQFLEGPDVLAASSDYLIVRWVTDEPATTSMSYEMSQDPQSHSIERLGYSKEHLVVITDLQPGALYDMDVRAMDASGNSSLASLNDIEAGTLTDAQAPSFVNGPVVTSVSIDVVDVSFTSSEYGSGSLDCTSAGDAKWSATSASLALEHSVSLADLDSGTTYDCVATLVDSIGNQRASEVFIVSTGGESPDDDGDGLNAEQENALGTDPTVADSDQDGVNDGDDHFPLDATEHRDTDGDLVGNSQDADDDGDGIPDSNEIAAGLDPLDPSDAAADLDGDGLANLQEFLDGSRIDEDSVPPTFEVPANLQVVGDGVLTAVAFEALMAMDETDGEIEVEHIPKGPWSPGRHFVSWYAQDAAGNQTSALQVLDVVPTAMMTAHREVEEGSEFQVNIHLTGPAASYPVLLPIEVSGSAMVGVDFEPFDTPVVIDRGTTATFTIRTIADELVDQDRLNLRIVRPINAAVTMGSDIDITLTESNIPPLVSLTMQQGAQSLSTVVAESGPIIISAEIEDPNDTDDHRIDWVFDERLPSGVISVDGPNVSIDPDLLDEGVYTVSVRVEDDGLPGMYTTAELAFVLERESPTLSEQVDTDDDGINDRQEGAGDADDDRVVDYLDNEDAVHVLPLEASASPLEVAPGLAMRLGTLALQQGGGSASVALSVLTETGVALPVDSVTGEALSFPQGLIDFEVAGVRSGEVVQIVVPFSGGLPVNARYIKYSDNTGWVPFALTDLDGVFSADGAEGACPAPGSTRYLAGLKPDNDCIQLTIVDGGPNDSDGVADGVVRDPGGVATTGMPTENGSDTGSTGVDNAPAEPSPSEPTVAPALPVDSSETGPLAVVSENVAVGGGLISPIVLLGLLFFSLFGHLRALYPVLADNGLNTG